MTIRVRFLSALALALLVSARGLFGASPSSASTTSPTSSLTPASTVRPAEADSCTTSGKMCIFVGGSGTHVTSVSGGVAPSGGVVNGKKWCGTVYYGVNNTVVKHSPHACATVTSPYYWDAGINQYYPNGTKLCIGQYTDSGFYNPGGGACAYVQA